MADHSDASLFVGDLAPEVDDEMLYSFFRQYFGSVKTAKVIVDPTTGRSKGYGFVRFGVESERDRALIELAGAFLASRPLRISIATAKKPGAPGGAPMVPGPAAMPGPSMPAAHGGGGGHYGGGYSDRTENDPNNTTLFIGGLGNVSEEQLRSIFGRHGDIVYTKVPPGKGCGFVQFVDRKSAEKAMAAMNGQVVGVSTVRVSWGRSSTSKAAAAAAAAAAQAGHAPHTHYPAYHTHGGYQQPAAAGYYDPAAAAYNQHYYDPYGGQYHAAAYAANPAYAAYGMTAAGGYSADPSAHASVSGVAGASGAAGGTTAAAAKPAAANASDVKGPSVDDQNAAYMARHLPLLTGSCLRQGN